MRTAPPRLQVVGGLSVDILRHGVPTFPGIPEFPGTEMDSPFSIEAPGQLLRAQVEGAGKSSFCRIRMEYTPPPPGNAQSLRYDFWTIAPGGTVPAKAIEVREYEDLFMLSSQEVAAVINPCQLVKDVLPRGSSPIAITAGRPISQARIHSPTRDVHVLVYTSLEQGPRPPSPYHVCALRRGCQAPPNSIPIESANPTGLWLYYLCPRRA